MLEEIKIKERQKDREKEKERERKGEKERKEEKARKRTKKEKKIMGGAQKVAPLVAKGARSGMPLYAQDVGCDIIP